VLIVHLTGWLVGGRVDFFDESLSLSFRIGQHAIISLCVVCVNLFLIISGWYGVKLTFSGLWKMWTLLVGIYIPCQIFSTIYAGVFLPIWFVDNFIAFSRESYFVQCYLMLMFLSPVINLFFEKYQGKTLTYVLVFWGIEVFLETCRNNVCLYFMDGYSLIHFVLIYMLARAFSFHKEQILKIKRGKWVMGYFACALVYFVLSIYRFPHIGYSCPVVVIESFCLFFPFLYKSFYNKWINWVAASTFAVYILHTCSPLIEVLSHVDRWLLKEYPYGIYLVSYLMLSVVTFFACILYDKVRIKVTDALLGRVRKYLEVKTRKAFETFC
jgi:hypothetical protein